ncbi:MAG: protein kinase [Alphaproteobacteria bacterium]|nr:protein kinase [Alphaproteobacteria bacterium]
MAEVPAVIGPYEVTAPLASGGMGTVWLAVHEASGLPAALKVLKPEVASPESVEALEAEIRAVASLVHPHVVQVLDAGLTPSLPVHPDIPTRSPWLAMELCQGRAVPKRPRSWDEVRAVLVPVLDALAHAHARGVLHRDVKLGNILRGGDGRIRLSDFGLAHVLGGARPGLPGGTPGYMPPEQRMHLWRDQGPWTDLYAVGATALRMLTGRSPDPGGALGPVEAPFPLPGFVTGWLATLLAPEPAHRFQRAADALEALGAAPTLDPEPPGPVGLGLFGARETPFVGRAAERQRLWDRLDTSGAVVLRGVAGVGKTRLSEWLARRGHAAGRVGVVRVTHGSGRSDGLEGAAIRALQVEGADPLELEDVVGWRVADPWARSAIVDLCAGRSGGRLARFAAFGQLLRALHGDRPTLLLVDDAHAGPEAVRFVRWALDAGAPLTAVLTAREEEIADDTLDALEEHPRVESMEIGPLPPEEERALVGALLPLEGSAVERVVERAGGNPLFAVQLVEDWVSRSALVDARGVYTVVGAEDTLPHAIEALWRRRLDEVVPAEAWQCVEIAAVLGREVHAFEWHAACAAAGVGVHRGVVLKLVGAGLARLDPEKPAQRWSFVHGMLRDTLLERIRGRGRAERWHVAAAKAVGDDPERRAMHLLAAGRSQEALEPLWDAAQKKGMHDPGAARALLERRLEALAERPVDREWARTWLSAARYHRLESRYEPSGVLARRGLAWARANGDVELEARALAELALNARMCGHLDEARQALSAASALGPLSYDVQLDLDSETMHLLSETGDIEGAIAVCRRALAGDPKDGARVDLLTSLAYDLGQLGRLDEARDAIRLAGEAAERTGSPLLKGEVALVSGELCRFAADYVGAERSYGLALEESRRFFGEHQPALVLNLAMVRLEQGRLDEAREGFDAGLAMTGETNPIVRWVALCGRLEIAVLRAEPVEPWLTGIEALPAETVEPDGLRMLRRAAARADGEARARMERQIALRT